MQQGKTEVVVINDVIVIAGPEHGRDRALFKKAPDLLGPPGAARDFSLLCRNGSHTNRRLRRPQRSDRDEYGDFRL